MAVCNAAELFGQDCAKAVGERLAELPRFAGELRPVYVDARLQPWEWLRRVDGTLCKTDAVDHAEAHDLVGCQDIAWDVAGASIEFSLSPQETRDLAAEVATTGGRVADAELIEGLKLCYAALQIGAWTMAEASADGCERRRIDRHRELYSTHLRAPT
jgi:hypothetical protein